MDSIIRELIEIDAAAELKISAANSRLNQARDLLESEKAELKKSKDELRENQIRKYTESATLEFECRARELDQKFSEARLQLESLFDKKGRSLADELVNSVILGE